MLEIRTAGIHELQLIHDLAHRIWPASYAEILSQEQLEYMLEMMYSLPSLQNQFLKLNHKFLILLDDKVPIGYASYSIKDAEPKTCILHKIYVLNEHRGKGAGRVFIDRVANEARLLQAEKLELTVNRKNKAKEFYEKLGFQIIDLVDKEIGSGFYMNDYIMRKRL